MKRCRWLAMLFGLLGMLLLLPCNLNAAANKNTAESFEQASQEEKNGLVKEGSHYCYYKNGVKQKNVWKRIKGYRYYFSSKGYAVTSCINIDGTAYVFDKDGHLIQPSKKQILKSGDNYFYVDTDGKAQTGWFRIKNKLYRADPKGRMYKNRTHEGVIFGSDCVAKENTASALKLQTMKIVESITNSKMTKSQKLYACWKYIVSSGKFYYYSDYPDVNKVGWQKECALRMLVNHRGNCFGFACAFAALASEVGYEPYVVRGRVAGSRDQASDGMTRHAWVKIGNGYYDPEGVYAGWSGYIYGRSYYPIYHSVIQVVNFRKSNLEKDTK